MRGYLLFAFFITFSLARGQQLMKVTAKNPVICYASTEHYNTHVPAPTHHGKAGAIKTSTIQVVFSPGFPQNAKTAFEHAAGIWEGLIDSPVPIKIQAFWSNLNEGVLGSAIYWSAFANFDGAQKQNVFYPVALAEKIARKELNDEEDFEILANFSSNINWYFGTDGNSGAAQYDFVTVVLHEIGHGLGFSSSFEVEGTNGVVGAFNTSVPIIFDTQIENSSAVKLVQGFTSPSGLLRSQLISNNLKINITKTPVASAQLYAPATFDGGSSISHLNESSYSGGSGNSLMTPQIGLNEIIHNPGPLTLGILSDMGWEIIGIQHTRLPNTENVTGPYTATVKLINDGDVQYNAANVKLNYTTNGTTFTQVTMNPTGNQDEFSADIPGVAPNQIPFTYGYFISVGDNVGRTVLKPGKLVSVGQAEQQNIFVFRIGPDTEKPIITHVKEPFLKDDETELEINAIISDNIGIGSAKVEYSINGGAFQEQTLTLIEPEEDSVYTTTLNLGALSDGDEIRYKITAIDNSNNPKTAVSPATGFHTVGVYGFSNAVTSYANNFNTASSDFFGNGFSITTPTGFTSGAIHSDHPYAEGDAFPDDEYSLMYILKIPIEVADVNARMLFDEVALVEPGAPGSVFGDADFFDYVVVEGSKDFGETWTPLADGYDAREHSNWEIRYNSSIVGNNSTATGNATFYHSRSINLQDEFEAGDEIIIRFRLFSDQLASGWGWAIDDLHIQDAITGVEEGFESSISVFPNPSKGNITLEASNVTSPAINIQLMNTQGTSVYKALEESVNGKMTHTISSEIIPAGVYFVKVTAGNRSVVKKVVKVD